MSVNFVDLEMLMSPLEPLGLSARAELMYRTMLMRPAMGLFELASALDCDVAAIRSDMDELAELSLIRPSGEVPGKAVPVSPRVALDSLIAQRSAELLEQQQALEMGRMAASELVATVTSSRGTSVADGVEYLSGVDETRDRVEELSHQISSEALAIIPFARLDQGDFAENCRLDQELLARGVKVKSLYLDSSRNDPAARRYANWLTKLGGEVRTAPLLPKRVILLDGTTAILASDSEGTPYDAVIVQERDIVGAMVSMFKVLWNSADPLGTSERPNENGLTSQEEALLRLLATGITDEAVSKQLGISLRSVRRIMSDLMTRLEAGSRFEAGVNAARRGWL